MLRVHDCHSVTYISSCQSLLRVHDCHSVTYICSCQSSRRPPWPGTVSLSCLLSPQNSSSSLKFSPTTLLVTILTALYYVEYLPVKVRTCPTCSAVTVDPGRAPPVLPPEAPDQAQPDLAPPVPPADIPALQVLPPPPAPAPPVEHRIMTRDTVQYKDNVSINNKLVGSLDCMVISQN